MVLLRQDSRPPSDQLLLRKSAATARSCASPTNGPVKQTFRYCIGREIGSGAYGKVYRSSSPRRGRSLAIKVVTRTEDDKQSIHSEVHALQVLSGHANIVRFIDWGCLGDKRWFVAMEMVDVTLEDILRRRSLRFSEDITLAVARQILMGLCYVHANDFSHNDIGRSNIGIRLRTGQVKILDFGSAEWADRRTGAQADVARLMRQQRNDVSSSGLIVSEVFLRRPCIPEDVVTTMRINNLLDETSKYKFSNSTFSSMEDYLLEVRQVTSVSFKEWRTASTQDKAEIASIMWANLSCPSAIGNEPSSPAKRILLDMLQMTHEKPFSITAADLLRRPALALSRSSIGDLCDQLRTIYPTAA
eukprot:scpid84502/ scgid1051/ Myosin-IIIa